MASDSKTTVTTTAEDRAYLCAKLVRHSSGDIIGCAGDADLIEKFVAWYKTKKRRPNFPKDAEFEALILTAQGDLVYYDETLSRDRLHNDCFAVGSGGNAARGAMLAGCDPITAVEIATKIDPHSGGPVQVMRRETIENNRSGE